MDITTFGGLIFGFICIIFGIFLGGELESFWDLPSLFIVFGGVFAATMVSYPLYKLRNMISVVKKAFTKSSIDLNEDIEMIITIAQIARKEGLLALENSIDDMDEPFLKKGVMLIVDGSDPELIKTVLESDIYFMDERHAQSRAIMESMSSFSPAFGMIGTLIGLINMLQHLSDPDALGPGMSTALVTTFYGCILANLLFTPLAKKLKTYSESEHLRKELLLEGMLALQDGENPRVIREKLNAFLPKNMLPPESSRAEQAEWARR